MASSLGMVTFKMKKCLEKYKEMSQAMVLPLQPLGNIVPSATRVNHGSEVAHVLIMKTYSFNIFFASYRQIDKVARLVQTVEPLLFDDSTEQLIGDLNKGQLSRLLCHEQHGMVT